MSEASGDGSSAPQAPKKPLTAYYMLENNPEVMNELARRLGLSEELSFYDVYSIYDADLLAIIPRPVHALLTTIPMTSSWKRNRDAEDANIPWYAGSGPDEPAVWFKQIIIDGCGLIGFLHCACNGVPREMIVPGSELAKFLEQATPLGMDDRAQLINDSKPLYEASEACALKGDTETIDKGVFSSNHFLALVKGRDGHLWELEGNRKGPLDRGALEEHEDVLSERALELGLKRLIEMQRDVDGEVRFSCIALAPTVQL